LIRPLKIFMDPEYRKDFPRTIQWWDRLLAVEGVGKAFDAPVKLSTKRIAADGSEADTTRTFS
jgi:elongation factor 1-gamma